MKLSLISIFFLLGFSSPGLTAPVEEISASADRFSNVLSGGYEVETNRKYLEVKLETGDPAYLVLYTLEGHAGTTAFHQWAALFQESSKSPDETFEVSQFALIGNSGWRSVDYSKANERQGEIVMPYKSWKKTDKACCPTNSGTGQLKFDNGEVVFVER